MIECRRGAPTNRQHTCTDIVRYMALPFPLRYCTPPPPPMPITPRPVVAERFVRVNLKLLATLKAFVSYYSRFEKKKTVDSQGSTRGGGGGNYEATFSTFHCFTWLVFIKIGHFNGDTSKSTLKRENNISRALHHNLNTI